MSMSLENELSDGNDDFTHHHGDGLRGASGYCSRSVWSS
jgi:hypothetical protein